jgi:hypothetical protein
MNCIFDYYFLATLLLERPTPTSWNTPSRVACSLRILRWQLLLVTECPMTQFWPQLWMCNSQYQKQQLWPAAGLWSCLHRCRNLQARRHWPVQHRPCRKLRSLSGERLILRWNCCQVLRWRRSPRLGFHHVWRACLLFSPKEKGSRQVGTMWAIRPSSWIRSMSLSDHLSGAQHMGNVSM